MARETLTEVQADIRAFLRDNDADFWTAKRLDPIINKIRKKVSIYFPNPKSVYCTTNGTAKEVNVNLFSDDIIKASEVEIEVGNDPPDIRNAKWDEVNLVKFFWNTTPTRVAIASIADAGGGDITITCSSVHSMEAGDYVTLTGSTGYDDTYLIQSAPTTLTLTVTATFAATGTGYVGQRIKVFYDGVHVLGATASSNTLSITGIELLKQGVIAYANLEWVQEFRRYVDQAADLSGSGNEVNAQLDLMTTRIESAISYLETGDDSLGDIPNWPSTVTDYASYAQTELAAARLYRDQASGYRTEISGNLDLARLIKMWESYGGALVSQFEAELSKHSRRYGSIKRYAR